MHLFLDTIGPATVYLRKVEYMPLRTAAAAITVLVIATLAAACGGGDSSSGEPSTTAHIKKL